MWLSELNREQQEAVLHTEGPLLILAGAGAGKTKVLTYRIRNLIEKGAPPQSIVAVTFTNKAAKEMSERVKALAGNSPTLPWTGTFHTLALSIIREFSAEAGLSRRFPILDRGDSLERIKKIIKDLGLDPKVYEAKNILGAISKAKGDGITRDRFLSSRRSYGSEITHKVWGRYDALMREEKTLDFDEIIVRALELLDIRSIREAMQARVKYIEVDEYQDINTSQYRLVTTLAEPENNICVVGDVDQNIYSWRGADLKHIMSFEERFPDAKVVVLTKNYRSTQTILRAANEAIEKNQNRRPKILETENHVGEPILVYGGYDENDEAWWVVSHVRELLDQGVPTERIAVLYRANFQSRVLEEAFLRASIDYKLLGTKFFERKEVKDILAHLRSHLPDASNTDVARALQNPARGIGKVALLKIFEQAPLSGAAERGWSEYLAAREKVRESLVTGPLSHVVKTVVETSGLVEYLKKGDRDDEERVANIEELVTVASKYDGFPIDDALERFLDEATLHSDQDDMSPGGVRLMTIHASKGLEFAHVFVTGLEEGLFPYESNDIGRDQEEERRLFYVAVTRAEERLYLSYARTRRIFGTTSMTVPSQFVLELPDDLVEEESSGTGEPLLPTISLL